MGPTLNNALAVPNGIYLIDPIYIPTLIQHNIILIINSLKAKRIINFVIG